MTRSGARVTVLLVLGALGLAVGTAAGPVSAGRPMAATVAGSQVLELGSGDNVLGYAPFPTTLVTPTTPEGFYLENKGPYTYKQSGDAYSPYFESFNSFRFTANSGPDIPNPAPNPCGPGDTQGNCALSNGTTTTPNADRLSTAFNGYDYIIDDPITNTLVVKLFDPYDELGYDTAARSWDVVHSTAYAPSDSNNFATLGISSTQTSGAANMGCVLGGDGTRCRTKYIDGSDPGSPFGSHETTLEFTLYGPGASATDPTLPRITTTSPPASCDTANCVYRAPFDAGTDPTTCTTGGFSICSQSPYAYRSMNYAIIHGPGFFRLNARSVVNADGTNGTRGNAFGIAVCADTSPSLGTSGSPITSDPFVNNSTPVAGWNAASCANPNAPAHGGQCANPARPRPTDLCIRISGLGKMAIHSWLAGGKTLIPLGSVPPDAAGKTLEVRLYDVGDVLGGPNTLEVLTPAGDLTHLDGSLNTSPLSATAMYSSSLPYSYSASPEDGSGVTLGYRQDISVTQALASDRIDATSGGFNGSWLTVDVPVQVPQAGGYSGLTSGFGTYWKLLYDIGGAADDAMTVAATLGNGPQPTPTSIPLPSASATASATPTSSPPPSATASPTPAAMVVLSPTLGTPLQTLTVTGTNFTAGQGVALWWDQASTVLSTTAAGPNGNFVTTVRIPPAVVGLHRVLAAQGNMLRASAPVTVGPHLYLGPSPVAAGGRVYAAGLGFAAREQVAVVWNNPRQLMGTATADALGSFTGTATISFTVPISAPTGVNVVYGRGQTSHAIGYGLVVIH